MRAISRLGTPQLQAEMSSMIVEKAAAIAEAQFAASTAAAAGNKDHVIAGKALKVFRKRVRTNRRRLSRRLVGCVVLRQTNRKLPRTYGARIVLSSFSLAGQSESFLFQNP